MVKRTVTFGGDSGAEVTVISLDTASELSERAWPTASHAMLHSNTLEYMFGKHFGAQGISWKHVFENDGCIGAEEFVVSCSLMDIGHGATFKKDQSYVWHPGTGQEASTRRPLHWSRVRRHQ